MEIQASEPRPSTASKRCRAVRTNDVPRRVERSRPEPTESADLSGSTTTETRAMRAVYASRATRCGSRSDSRSISVNDAPPALSVIRSITALALLVRRGTPDQLRASLREGGCASHRFPPCCSRWRSARRSSLHPILRRRALSSRPLPSHRVAESTCCHKLRQCITGLLIEQRRVLLGPGHVTDLKRCIASST